LAPAGQKGFHETILVNPETAEERLWSLGDSSRKKKTRRRRAAQLRLAVPDAKQPEIHPEYEYGCYRAVAREGLDVQTVRSVHCSHRHEWT